MKTTPSTKSLRAFLLENATADNRVDPNADLGWLLDGEGMGEVDETPAMDPADDESHDAVYSSWEAEREAPAREPWRCDHGFPRAERRRMELSELRQMREDERDARRADAR
jgi:hypothetical protein